MENELKVIDRRMEMVESEPVQAQQTDLVLVAMQKGYDPAIIEKMMELAERNQKNIARQAFYQAVSDFKNDPLVIVKDKVNSQFAKGGNTGMYTSLGNLLQTVNPVLGKHGLSVSFGLNQDNGMITVSCNLSHSQGHTESVSLSALPDTSGGNSKNPIQQIKSTITYLRATTFEAVIGLAAIEESNLDDDGNSAGKHKGVITEDQAAEIKKGIEEKNIPLDQYLGLLSKFVKVSISEIGQIPEAAYSEAIRLISKAKGKPKAISCPEKDGGDIPITNCESCEAKKAGMCASWHV